VAAGGSDRLWLIGEQIESAEIRTMKGTSGDTPAEDRCSSCGGFVDLCGGCAFMTPSPKGRIRPVTPPKGSGLQITGAKKPVRAKAKPRP